MSGIERTHNYSAQQIIQQTPKPSGWSKAGEFLGSMARTAASGLPFFGSVFSKVGVTSGFDTGFNRQYELILLQQQIHDGRQLATRGNAIIRQRDDGRAKGLRQTPWKWLMLRQRIEVGPVE